MDQLFLSHCCTFFFSFLFLECVNTGEFTGMHWSLSPSFDTHISFFFSHDIDHGAMSFACFYWS